jgi:hypothetical protein
MKKTIAYFHLTLNLIKMTIAEEVTLAISGLLYASDPVYTSPSITQAVLRALATTVQNDLGSRINLPNPNLTVTEQQHVDALSRGIMTVKSEVEVAANKYAQGNLAMFETVALRIGLHPSKAHSKHVRIVAFLPSEKGCFHFEVPAEGKKSTYIYQFGPTLTEGTPPTATTMQTVPLDRTDLIMTGYASGTIIGLHYAVQQTPSTKKPVTPIAISTAKIAVAKTVIPSGVLTILPVNAKNKVTMAQGVNYWHFSNFMYYRIP